mmetsp:Transcript_54924/g.153169  ORF Transcript_54924/g.153169 Transcript_54924/m.153169 type:complete len:215 (+) Transcript_54924:59-703(+)
MIIDFPSPVPTCATSVCGPWLSSKKRRKASRQTTCVWCGNTSRLNVACIAVAHWQKISLNGARPSCLRPAGDVRNSFNTVATFFPSSRSLPAEKRTSSDPGPYSRSAHFRYSNTLGATSFACFANSICVSCKSSLVVYFKKNNIVSMCDSNPLKSFGAVVLSSTNALARERNTWPSASLRSTSLRQMSKSAKSNGPKWGHVETLRTMSFCTELE